MRFFYIIIIAGLAGLASCNNAGTGNTGKTDTTRLQVAAPAAPVHSKINDTGTTMLMTVMSKYYGLKNALVATKAPIADSAANELVTATEKLSAYVKADATNGPSIKLFLDTIITQSKIVAALKDESCERQRLAFGTLSSAMYGLLKNVDLKNAKVYHQYCPMAFNEKGAYWLSDDAEIKNPYFGKKMLECGEETDSL